jgi:hypothetical protein
MMKLLHACLLSAALLPACASSGGVGGYLEDRGGDLVDILQLHVMAGKVGAVQVDATRFFTVGITYEDNAWAWGLHNRGVGQWNEDIIGCGLILGRHDENRVKGISHVSGSYGWDFSDGMDYSGANGDNPLDWLTFRATVALGLGIDVEVRVGEAIDFVLGIFTIDLANDD